MIWGFQSGCVPLWPGAWFKATSAEVSTPRKRSVVWSANLLEYKGRFPIKEASKISLFIFIIRMPPPFAAALPFFLFMKNFGLLDTRLALIMARTIFNLPFVVWMMMEFILALPCELEEAGMVDALTRMQAFQKLLLPLLKPSLVAV